MKIFKRCVSLIMTLSLLATMFSFTAGTQAVAAEGATPSKKADVSYGDDIKRDGPDTTPWTAKWIWASDNTSMHNWICLRKSFSVDSVPETAVARIAVDSRYWLYVNGTEVIRDGQVKRGPTQNDTYFEYVDLAPYLKAGQNTVAVLALYYGKDSQYYSYSSSGKGAFVMEAQIGDYLLKTDSTWKVKRHSAFLNRQNTKGEGPSYRIPEEHLYYDARLDNELNGWTGTSFDDSSWSNAIVYGSVGDSPWGNLWERSIPQMKYWERAKYTNDSAYAAYKNTATTGTVSLVMKLPYNMQVEPYLKVEASAGKEIQCLSDGTESLNTYYVTDSGVQEFEGYYWMSAQTITYVVPAGVKILELGYRQSGYNTEFTGSFECEDSSLNTLWQKSLYTLYITMRDNYMDCPDRERAQWWGDVTVESNMTFYSLDPDSYLLYRKGVDTLINWRNSDKVLQTVVPITDSYFELPLQQLAGVVGFWTYYLYTGETDFAEQVYQPAVDYLKLWSMASDGLVMHRSGSWDWPDWGTDYDVPVMENAWYYYACSSVVKLANALGKTEDLAFLYGRMNSIKAAYDTSFWTGSAYHSTNAFHASHDYSIYTTPAKPDDRANALAVLSGIAGEDKYAGVLNVLQTQTNSSPYMEKYVLDAMFDMGCDTEALTRMKNRYSEMINDERTTLWEHFVKSWGTQNHAWSGGPLVSLSGDVAGVAPDTAGYETYHVTPQLGSLNQVSVSVPSVKGDIKVTINRDTSAKTYSLSLSSPENTTARVAIERMSDKNIRIQANGTVIFQNGKPTDGISGVTYDGGDSDYIYFLVDSGVWSFYADTIAPTVKNQYNVELEKTDGGTVTVNGSPLTAEYVKTLDAGTELTLTATASNGYEFAGFNGSFFNGASSFTFTVNSDTYLKAVFKPKASFGYNTLTFKQSADTDLAVRVNGTVYAVPCAVAVKNGETATIEGLDGSYWDFECLTGDLYTAQKTTQLVMNKDMSFTVKGRFKGGNAENLALGKSVSMDNLYESDSHSQWRRANLTDGVFLNDGGCTTEAWSASSLNNGALSTPTTITIDLGHEEVFNLIKIYPRGSYDSNGDAVNFMVDYSIELKSSYDSEFHTVYTKTGQKNPKNAPVDIKIPTESARYIKISVSRLGTPLSEGSLGLVHRLQLSEVGIYKMPDALESATLSISGSGSIYINGELNSLPLSKSYPISTELTLEPCIPAGKKLIGFSGDVSTAENPLYVKMDTDISLGLNYADATEYKTDTNLALGKSVSASNEYTGNSLFSSAYLTDGILRSSSTRKCFTTNPLGSTNLTNKQYIDIDLGEVKSFNLLMLYPRTDVTTTDGKAPNFPLDFDVLVRNSTSESWSTAASFRNTANPYGSAAQFSFEEQSARYVRLLVSRVSANASDESFNRLQLCEIELFKAQRMNSASAISESLVNVSSNDGSYFTKLNAEFGFTGSIKNSGVSYPALVWSIENADGSPSEIARLNGSVGGSVTLETLSLGKAYLVARTSNNLGIVSRTPFEVSSINGTDVNADGATNLKDLLRLKTNFANSVSLERCDVNNDGTADASDIVYMKRFLLQLP